VPTCHNYTKQNRKKAGCRGCRVLLDKLYTHARTRERHAEGCLGWGGCLVGVHLLLLARAREEEVWVKTLHTLHVFKIEGKSSTLPPTSKHVGFPKNPTSTLHALHVLTKDSHKKIKKGSPKELPLNILTRLLRWGCDPPTKSRAACRLAASLGWRRPHPIQSGGLQPRCS